MVVGWRRGVERLLQGEYRAEERVLHDGILAQHLGLVHLHQACIREMKYCNI
jgi:hypothetical protein